MKVKEYTKWLLLLILTIIIYYLSIYNTLTLYFMNGVALVIGFYLMLNPGMLVKTTTKEFSEFKSELNRKLKDDEGDLEAIRRELLGDYQGQYVVSVIIGVFNMIVISLPICLVTISLHKWYEYVFIFCLLAFFLLHESRTFKYFPSSRYNRAKLKYFIYELQSNVNALDKVNKSTMIVNNIEMNHSEIKNDYSQIVYDNRALVIDNTKIQTINQTQTSIDNRVTNNDNRVLQNNFVTTIDNSKKETPQLNIESIFWKFIKLENGEQDVLLKYHRLTGVIHELNSRLFKIDKKEFFHISDNKIHFFSASPPKVLAEFTKYLIIEKYLDEEISYTNNRKYLLDIFEVPGGTPFKHFQNAIWKDIDRKNIIFYT